MNTDSGGRLTTQLDDKHDDFNFSIVNFPYLHVCNNIPSLILIKKLTELVPNPFEYINKICSRQTDFNCGLSCLADQEIELTAGVAGKHTPTP
jgi:hypothetical protein